MIYVPLKTKDKRTLTLLLRNRDDFSDDAPLFGILDGLQIREVCLFRDFLVEIFWLVHV